MFSSCVALNKKFIFFSLLCSLGFVFSPVQRVNAVESFSSDKLVANTEKKENVSLFSANENSTKAEATPLTSVAESTERDVSNSLPKATEDTEKKKLLLWGTHYGNRQMNAPVTVSTTNSTLSVIKKAQRHEKQLPSTNSTLLPGLNATLPVTMPSSNMPQITPITDW